MDKSIVFKITSIFLVLMLLAACSGNYALIEKRNIDFAEHCLEMQHAEKQELLAQQQRFTDAINKLDARLDKPLELKGPLINMPAPETPKKVIDTTPVNTHLANGDKQLVGEIERVWFPELDLDAEARIDTGATTSSMDVSHAKIFERDGKKWVRFKLDTDKGEDSEPLERKLERQVRIIQSSTDKEERRPVVRLKVKIGKVEQNADFTLTDRSHLDFPVLIGRNVLRDFMLVDVSKKHVTKIVKPSSSDNK